jgi:hypothetical protein
MPLTLCQAQAAIEMIVPGWPPPAVHGFLLGTTEERAAILQCLRDSTANPPSSVWPGVLGVLKECAEVAGDVSTIAGAIASVFGAVALL